ncbi:MAG: ATP-dependent Clp protease proteolytic subunit [Spirochaetota bacterium]|nr:MAG: ATP-dependent Clp protease proteolytic subunit [Spirochaetota bacterium]
MAEKSTGEEDFDRLRFIEKELIETRTIIISEAIDAKLAKSIYSKLLILEKDSSGKSITVIVNSHGGSADSGFGIYDMLKFAKPSIITITAGLCASAAIIVFLAGDKKKRFALPNSRFLIHQPSTSAVGPASDLEITANQILKIRDQFNLIIANETGQDVKKITEDANRDFWMNASEAVEYGLVSKIIETRSEIEKIK